MKQICSVLLLMVFISCYGHSGTSGIFSTPEKGAGEPVKFVDGQPRIVRPTGIDPHANIRCAIQDKKGNLWFCTTGVGVFRYDGKSFINFTEKDGLNNNTVYCIAEDKAGNIWLGTRDGVCSYNGKAFNRLAIPGIDEATYSFFRGTPAPKHNPESLNDDRKSVFSIIQDKAGNLWFGTGSMGLFRYDGRSFLNLRYCNNEWRTPSNDSIEYDDGLNRNNIRCMLEDQSGNIWFSAISHRGVYCFDGKSFTHYGDRKTFGDSHIGGILEDKKGDLWFATRDGLVRYDGIAFTNIIVNNGLRESFTSSMMQDKEGNIWLGSSRKSELGSWESYITRYDGKTSAPIPVGCLANTSIWSIFENKKGEHWLGGGDLGLYRYDGKFFTIFSDGC